MLRCGDREGLRDAQCLHAVLGRAGARAGTAGDIHEGDELVAVGVVPAVQEDVQGGPAGGGTPGSTERSGIRGPRPTLTLSREPKTSVRTS